MLLVDTDIGSDIDDALALLLLLHLKDVWIAGVTTVYGNVELRARIAHRILACAGVKVPVAAGIGFPRRPLFPLWDTGVEGEGLLSESEMRTPLCDLGIRDDAPAFLVEKALAASDEVTILAIGALSNVAAALDMDTRFAATVGRIVFMGAGVTFRDPVPEDLRPGMKYVALASHNVSCDVEAARRVFAARVPIRVLTNDVTTRVWWDGRTVRTFLGANEPPETKAVGRLLDRWLRYRTHIFKRPVKGTCPHDPLTAAEAVFPGRFVEYVQGWITVRDDASTVFVPDLAGPHSVGVKVHVARFLEWMVPRLLQRGLDD